MKILAITADIFPNNLGGAEMHFVKVLHELAPRTEKITVLVGPDDSLKQDFKDNPNIDFVTVDYPHIPNFFGFIYIFYATPKAIWLTIKNRHDLVWAKQEYPHAQVGALVKMICRIPLYITTQNPSLHTEEFVFKGNAPKPVINFLTNFISPFISYAFKQADVVAAVSQYSAQLAKRIGAKQVVVIPNGVDQISSIKTKSKKQVNKLNIVTTSALIPRNGVDTLVEACALLPKNISWKLTIAGDGPMMTELQHSAEKLGIKNRVEFLGRVMNTKIPKLLDDSYVFARPSRAEGFGVSFAEAMAQELPVIGTPVGGITDFVKNKETGLLVPVDQPDKLAEAILELWKNKSLYKKLQVNAKKLIVTKYNWTNIGNEVYKAMSRLI